MVCPRGAQRDDGPGRPVRAHLRARQHLYARRGDRRGEEVRQLHQGATAGVEEGQTQRTGHLLHQHAEHGCRDGEEMERERERQGPAREVPARPEPELHLQGQRHPQGRPHLRRQRTRGHRRP